METIAIERSVWIKATRERVWQAIIQPEHLTQWYAIQYAWDIPVLEVGARVKFHNSATEVLHATIAELVPQEKFTLHWDATAHEGVALVTSFLITAEQDGFRVTIHESGYEQVPEAERQQWLNATGQGYSMSVENLKAFAEGLPLPYTASL